MQFVKGGRAAVTKSLLLSLCDLFSLETPGLNFARASCASLRHVLCKCHACIVPVGSSTYNIYSVASLLEEKGWNLATGQFPPCLTICIGERHDEIVNEFSTDLRAAVDFLDATPSYKPSGAAAVYGAMPTTPTVVLEEVVRSYVDMRMSIKPAES